MTQEQLNLNWDTYSDHLKEIMQTLMETNRSADVTLHVHFTDIIY